MMSIHNGPISPPKIEAFFRLQSSLKRARVEQVTGSSLERTLSVLRSAFQVGPWSGYEEDLKTSVNQTGLVSYNSLLGTEAKMNGYWILSSTDGFPAAVSGFVIEKSNPTAWLLWTAVHKSLQGQGFGEITVNLMSDLALLSGADKLNVWMFAKCPWNASTGFYKRLGFEKIEHSRGYILQRALT